MVSAHKELQELLEEETSLALGQNGSDIDAVKAMRKHQRLMAKRNLFKAVARCSFGTIFSTSCLIHFSFSRIVPGPYYLGIERWLAEAMYESKLSGLRGKAAREALLEAEAHEKKAAEAVEAEANLGTF